jgi:hypothetical protein
LVSPGCGSWFSETYTDANGKYSITLPVSKSGFDGYMELTGDSIFPTAAFWRGPMLTENMAIADSRVPTISDASVVFSLMKVKPDPGRGHIVAAFADCNGDVAGGVSLTVDTADSLSTTFYMIGGLPSTTATESDAGDAFGGVANVPAGSPATVTARLAKTGQVLATERIPVRAGFLAGIWYLEPVP